MKRLLIAFAFVALSLPCIAQNADEPASREDVLLYMRTMHSHDMMQKVMEVQAQSTQKLLEDSFLKDKGQVPPEFKAKFQKAMSDLMKNMPVDDMMQAMVPAYQKHFTHGDIEAMNAFYSSPVGQKVLQELPEVMRDGMQEMMPIMTKYMGDWQERLKHDFADTKTTAPEKNTDTPVQQ
jgi:uncharacterized protein